MQYANYGAGKIISIDLNTKREQHGSGMYPGSVSRSVIELMNSLVLYVKRAILTNTNSCVQVHVYVVTLYGDNCRG